MSVEPVSANLKPVSNYYNRLGRKPLIGDDTDPLTDKQELFVAEYLVDLNGKQAAIRAGYSPHTAASIASSLLKKLNVQHEIKRAYAAIYSSLGTKAQRVLAEIARLAFSDARELFDDEGRLLPIKSLPDSIAAAVSSVKVNKRFTQEGEIEHVSEVKLWSKPAALNLLGKHFGLLRDVIEHTGPGGGPLEVNHNQKLAIENLSEDAKRDILAVLVKHGLVNGVSGNGSNGGHALPAATGLSSVGVSGNVIDVTPRGADVSARTDQSSLTARIGEDSEGVDSSAGSEGSDSPLVQSAFALPPSGSLIDLMPVEGSDEEPITLQSREIAEFPR